MERPHPAITGILLAGGMSSRMGREKGEVMIGRRRLYEFPLQLLENLCEEILISTCKNPSPVPHHPAICDEIKGIGPMGGILSCLEQSTNDLNIILSYDMPLLHESLLEYLVSESKGYDIVVPALDKTRPEPLCAVYRKRITPVLRELISEKEFAVHKVIVRSRSKVLIIDDRFPFFHPGLFLNVNSLEDLDRLQKEI
jgi:molybdopterin-guanine dinucleotide biosynthesis protein A